MNSFTAGPGELIYDEDAHGPRQVTRTCSGCGKRFRMVVEGEYTMHVVCDFCEAVERSIARARRIERETFTSQRVHANHQGD